MAINYPLPFDVGFPNFEKFILRSAHASCSGLKESQYAFASRSRAARLVATGFPKQLG